MIQKNKEKNALYALQHVLIRARTMAYESNNAKLAELLDYAEYLPDLIARPEEDCTETFRQNVTDIAEKFRCQHAIEIFESGR